MNGSVEHATVQYVSRPYKRRRSAPSDSEVIEIAPPTKSVNIDTNDESPIKSEGISPKDMSSVTLKKLETAESIDRLSPFSKMLINPDDKKDCEVISLDPASPLPHSPISISSNILSDSFLFPDSSRALSPPTCISPHTNGISIYAEANARSKVCKPVLLIKRQSLSEEVASQLTAKYSYLYPNSKSGDSSSDEDTEIKLKEFVQDYMLQKRYKGVAGSVSATSCSKAKMKKTPTLAELKVVRQKKKLVDETGMSSSRHSDFPAHSHAEATIISESEGSAVEISDSEYEPDKEDKKDIQVIEATPKASTTIESLQAAYEQVHKKRTLYPINHRTGGLAYTFGNHRGSQPCRNSVDLREPPPTMLLHKSHYEGVFNYITKEHDYSLYYDRPKNLKWEVYKNVPNPRVAVPPPPPLTPANSLLVNALPRPNYVMSEPWLFVPNVEDSKNDAEEYQQALGFETVIRHMLKAVDSPQAAIVECAKCKIDFSSEWFTFMSQRLCKSCYKAEVKSRNSIIYLTNISHIARKVCNRKNT